MNGTLAEFEVSVSRSVTPETLTARLTLTVTGDSLEAVQQQLNAKMAALVAVAKRTKGVKVSTNSYYSGQNVPTNAFSAEQSIVLTSTRGCQTLLKTVAELQAQGMALNGLNYTLSPDQAGSLEDALLAEAMDKAKATVSKLATLTGAKGVVLDRINPVFTDRTRPQGMRMTISRISASEEVRDAPVAEAAESVVSLRVGFSYRLLFPNAGAADYHLV